MARRRILVPVDFCPHSDAALYFARKIALKSNDMISCIHVMEEQGSVKESPASIEIRRKMRRDAEYKLSERVNSILKSEERTAFELIITSGKVHQKILEKASELNARLIVMGRSDSRNSRIARIGSNLKYILAQAHIPVIAMNEKIISEKSNVIVSLDLSTPADTMVKCAVDTARLMDADVILISVIGKEMASLEPAFKARLKETRQLLRAHNIKCNSHLLYAQGSVSEEILAFTNRIDSAVILLIAGPEKDNNSSDIGSVALEVIAHSKLPVQCINPSYASSFMVDELS